MFAWSRIAAGTISICSITNSVDILQNTITRDDVDRCIANPLVIGLFWPVMIPTMIKEMTNPEITSEYVLYKYFRPVSFRRMYGNTGIPMGPAEFKRIWIAKNQN